MDEEKGAVEVEKQAECGEEGKKDAGKREVTISDCPVLSVVVYPDRAEVT